ncbi:hypothetical protein VPH35_028503 [Triticum aestivum]
MYDSDYRGLADDGDKPICCKCNSVPSKFVGFEGCWTGRMFLACSGEVCELIYKMYTEGRDGRVHDAFNNVETRFKFTDEIEKLHHDVRNAQDELKQMVEENQVTLAMKAKSEEALADARATLEEEQKLDASTTSMHRFLLVKAEKERDQVKEDKKRLEYMIEDLLTPKEGFTANIKKIKYTCDE